MQGPQSWRLKAGWETPALHPNWAGPPSMPRDQASAGPALPAQPSEARCHLHSPPGVLESFLLHPDVLEGRRGRSDPVHEREDSPED